MKTDASWLKTVKMNGKKIGYVQSFNIKMDVNDAVKVSLTFYIKKDSLKMKGNTISFETIGK